MAKRKPPQIVENTPIGRDVDLDQDDVRLKDGRRLTDEVVAEIVEQVRRGAGRSSPPTTAAARKTARGGDGQR